MGLLTRIEDIISIPMEKFHTRRGFHPVDLNRLAVRCMEQGSRRGIKKVYAPNRFRILLNPEDYRELYPFLDMIRSEITGELRLLVDERKYLLAGEVQMDIVEDPDTPVGLPQIKYRMQENGETESVERMSDQDVRDRRTAPSPSRDSDTVILLAEPESDAEKRLEDGVGNLKEGQPQIAFDKLSDLSDADDELEASPRFHAAMAVALEMMGRPEEALSHYRRIEAIDGPRPMVQRRIEWIENAAGRPDAAPAAPTPLGFLETGVPGAVIRLDTGGIYLENRHRDPAVRVNGEIVAETALKDGGRIQIGNTELIFRAVTEIRE